MTSIPFFSYRSAKTLSNKIKQKLFIVVSLALTSCMTINSSKYYNAAFYTNVPNTSVQIDDSTNHLLPAKIALKHSMKNLNIKVLRNDSIINNIRIESQLSNEFFWGNAYTWSIPGMIIDVATGRGFNYGKYFIVDSLGNITSLKRPTQYMSKNMSINALTKYKRGNFNILLSIPEVNLFHLSPQNEVPQNLSGFLGVGIGAEYFYKNNKSLQLRSDAIMDFMFPFPAPFDQDDFASWESCYAFNLNLTDNFHFKKFQLGYGLNYAKNTWIYHGYYNKPFDELKENEEPEWIDGREKTNNALGLIFDTYYRFSDHFYFGVIYRPSFWNLSNSKLLYEHSISFDLLWKINWNN